MRYRGFIAVIMAALTIACQREDGEMQQMGSDAPITFQTRAGGTENPVFANGEKMGMFVTVAGEALKSADNHYTNVCLTLEDGVWGGSAMYYPNASDVDIYNYAPFQEAVADVSALNVDVSVNQSVAGAYRKSDFLWAKTAGVAKTKEELEVVLKHRMSKAEIRLIAGNGVTEEYLETAASVKLLNVKTTAEADLGTGEVKIAGDAAGMTVTTALAGDLLWMAIVAPQALAAGTNAIEITLADGVKRVYKLEHDVVYQAGKVKRFDVTVSNESLSVSVVSLEEWTSDGTLAGNAVLQFEISGDEKQEVMTVGDSMGIYLTKKDVALAASGNDYDNVRLSLSATGWVGQPMYYPNNNSVDVYAYVPYQPAAGNATAVSFMVAADQSVAADYKNSDFLYAKTADCAMSNLAVEMKFGHRMGKAEIVLKAGDGMSEEYLKTAAVKLTNVKTGAVVNLTDGKVGVVGNSATVTPAGKEMAWKAIVVPQVVNSGTALLEITLGGQKRVYTTDRNISFESGKVKKFEITAGNGTLSVKVITIEEWTDDADVVTGEAKIQVSAPEVSGDGAATGLSFAEDAQLGMFFYSKGALMTDGGNVLYTVAADGSVNSETTLYYPSGDAVDLYAYAPFSALAVGSEAYAFSVAADQTVVGAVNTSDLLLAEVAGLKNGGPVAALTFDHAMSKVLVKLEKGNGVTEADLNSAQVEICNTALSAVVNLKTGGVSRLSGKTTVIPVKTGVNHEAIVIPQTVSGELFVKVSIAGAVWGYRPESPLVLKAGSRHTLKIKVTNTGISVGAPVISGWNEEAPIDGEGMKPQGAMLNWTDGQCPLAVWTRGVAMWGDQLFVSGGGAGAKTYVYIHPKGYDGVILEFDEQGMPGRVITAGNEGHSLAKFFTFPEGNPDKLGMGVVTTDRQIAILEPTAIPAVFKTGKLTEKIRLVIGKLATVLSTNGMESQVPPASLGCESALIDMLEQVDLDHLPSFAANGTNLLEECGVETACDLVTAVTPAGKLVSPEGGGDNTLVTTEQEYQNEIDLIESGSQHGFGDVKVTLKWETQGDVDLYLIDPKGHNIYHNSKSCGCGGALDVDDQRGTGPENIFFPKGTASQGNYKVKVKNYGITSSVGYTLFIYAKGKTKTYSGTLVTKDETVGSTAYFTFDLNGYFAPDNSASW